jgi:hypothetical protein
MLERRVRQADCAASRTVSGRGIALTSVDAFQRYRDSSDVSCRVTGAASSQHLVNAAAKDTSGDPTYSAPERSLQALRSRNSLVLLTSADAAELVRRRRLDGVDHHYLDGSLARFELQAELFLQGSEDRRAGVGVPAQLVVESLFP